MLGSSRTAAASLAGALALGAGGGIAAYAVLSDGGSGTKTIVRQVTVHDSTPAATGALSVSQIYQRTNRGVVEITVTSQQSISPFGGGSQESAAQGSGFVYDVAGHIVTNEHVIDGAQSISVRFWDGSVYKATLVGSDPSTDVAVIKVGAPSSKLHPLALGDSSKLVVGQGVVAIGSPFGLEETVTSGIVSALHRQMTAPNNFTINDSIQTDAAINHGNSGGPLLDAEGRVIGVNSQIKSDSGGNDGIGFAVPSNTIRTIASQLLYNGNVQHAYLGVAVATVPASVARSIGSHAGVALTEVRSGTPAASAGLRAATGSRTVGGTPYPTGGDVITAVNGKAIATATDLQAAIDARRPGQKVSITYWRAGKTHTVSVKLANRPS
jgi:S1-C subfamily serine protease